MTTNITSNITQFLNASNENGTDGNHGNEEEKASSEVILFIFASCAIGALVRFIVRITKIPLPYTVVLLVLGVLFGLLAKHYESVHPYAQISDVDPHLILAIFLPVLIFEAAYAMEVHMFLKSFLQVILLAVPGVALASFLTCIMAKFMFNYGWNWHVSMMFGSLLSATDPVAVVSLLRECGVSKQMATLIEGESLMNDGTAIVLFNVFLKLSLSQASISGEEIFLYFVRVALGGPLFGFFIAKVTLFWLSHIFNDVLSEITITLTATYLTYYIGEMVLGVSGVLAVVVLGVAMSAERTSISPEVEVFLHRFWEVLAYLANTLIFILVGVMISQKAIDEIYQMDWFYMIALYFGLNIIRGVMIALFSPILRHIGYGMTWREGIIMTWSGLRGAVALSMALLVAKNKDLDSKTIGNKVLVHVSGIVALTLIINATTEGVLLKLLGMRDISPVKRMAMANAMRYLMEMRKKSLNMLKTDRFLADADWRTVEKACIFADPYIHLDQEKDDTTFVLTNRECLCPKCHTTLPVQPNPKELADMMHDARLRMLKVEKMCYWRQFEQGMLSREAVRKLQECTEVAADNKGKFVDIEDIKNSWHVQEIVVKVKRFIKRVLIPLPLTATSSRLVLFLRQVVEHVGFKITVYLLLAMDVINVILAIIVEQTTQDANYSLVIRTVNLMLVGLYLVEAILRGIAAGKAYLKSCWNFFCLFIIVLGITDIMVGFILIATADMSRESTQHAILALITLRSIRFFRFVEPLLPLSLMLLKYHISRQLSFGYDIGRGYVAGEEEVSKLINHMIDNKDVAKQLQRVSDNSRLEVIKMLGLLQRQHPDIALSIKTRQAIRTVLNSLRDCIQELSLEGILEESEKVKLEEMVEARMKKLLSAPPSIPLPPPETLLENVTWLHGQPELMQCIKTKAKLVNYHYGDVILREGDPPEGIYFLVSGMVRLDSTMHYWHQSTQDTRHPEPSTQKLIDFMTAGNVIGEMGFLTGLPRTATVTCETSVQLFFISMVDMLVVVDKFTEPPSLEYRLWHVCSNRIATTVLMNRPAYHGLTKEKIKLRLEHSYIATIDDDNTFTVHSDMADIILINGHAMNTFTREKFDAPCYIPWTVLKLTLLADSRQTPIILVIPNETEMAVRPDRTTSSQGLAHNLCLTPSCLSGIAIMHSQNTMASNKQDSPANKITKSFATMLSGQSNGTIRRPVDRGAYYRAEASGQSHQGGRRLSTPDFGNPTSRLRGMLKSSLDTTQEADEDDEEGEIITSAPLTVIYQPDSSGEASTSHQDEVEDSQL